MADAHREMTLTHDPLAQLQSGLTGLSFEEVVDLVHSLPPESVPILLADTNRALAGDKLGGLLDIAASALPDYLPRAHAEYLAERFTSAIDRAEQGEQVRLIVCLPPGAGKSSLGSIVLPLYTLNRHPEWEVGLVSGDAALVLKFSRDVRRAILEGHVAVDLADRSGSVAASEWETAAKGGLIARGMTGNIAGRRLRLLCIDDPIKSLADAYSQRSRDAAWEHWQGTLKPRMRQSGSVVVLITTRWHEDDLAGRLMEAASEDAPWEEIRIPAIAEKGDLLGRAEGEPMLSPQVAETREQALARWTTTRREVGDYVWSALYQQRPSAPGGLTFKIDSIRYWTRFPGKADGDRTVFLDLAELVQLAKMKQGRVAESWDLTFEGEDSSDYVVGTRWWAIGSQRYLLHMTRGQWDFNEQITHMKLWGLDAEWNPLTHNRMVEKKANGAAALTTLRGTVGVLKPIKPTEPKPLRALAVTPQFEAGDVFLPDPSDPGNEWVLDVVEELRQFPTGTHDDIVDAISQFLNEAKAWGKAPAKHSMTQMRRPIAP